MEITVNRKPVTLTNETIAATRAWYIDNAQKCIEQAESGEVRVNNLKKYVQWQNERIKDMTAGLNDQTLGFIQQAYYIQTGESVALL